MTKTIHLDTLEGLPGKYLDMLNQVKPILEKNIFLDQITREISSLRSIVAEIDEYCSGQFVKAYHYTRANEQGLRKAGLLCRTGSEIRKSFLSEYQSLFSQEEVELISSVWENYFNLRQQRIRDQRVFFNVTKVALRNGGAQPLFDHYGGEQIHMPLNEYPELISKLSQIGTPLIVSFRLKANEAHCLGPEYPWGLAAMSSYHRLVQPEAFTHDFDAYIPRAIKPEDIIEIIEP